MNRLFVEIEGEVVTVPSNSPFFGFVNHTLNPIPPEKTTEQLYEENQIKATRAHKHRKAHTKTKPR